MYLNQNQKTLQVVFWMLQCLLWKGRFKLSSGAFDRKDFMNEKDYLMET